MASTYEPIATTTLASTAATINFSSIPSTYTDLVLIFVGNTAAANGVRLTFNGVTTTTYSQTTLYGDGTIAQSVRAPNQGYIDLRTSWPVIQLFMLTANIFSYANTAINKTLLFDQANDRNGSGSIEKSVGLWRSTSAISSLTLTAPSTTFNVGTTATLYGIKSA